MKTEIIDFLPDVEFFFLCVLGSKSFAGET